MLERAYAGMRTIEERVDLDRLDPETARCGLVEFTFDYHDARPDFIRLVAIENIYNAEHVKASLTEQSTNRPALPVVTYLLKRGYAASVLKRQMEAVDLHLMITALCYNRVSNRQIFSTIFECE